MLLKYMKQKLSQLKEEGKIRNKVKIILNGTEYGINECNGVEDVFVSFNFYPVENIESCDMYDITAFLHAIEYNEEDMREENRIIEGIKCYVFNKNHDMIEESENIFSMKMVDDCLILNIDIPNQYEYKARKNIYMDVPEGMSIEEANALLEDILSDIENEYKITFSSDSGNNETIQKK